MLHRLRQARLLWPTLAAMAALAVLVGLGNWQMQRKRWKDGLLASIAARVHAEPVPLSAVAPAGAGEADLEYLHVTANGRFLYDKERYVYAPMPAPAGVGWLVYTPLELSDTQQLLWVNRGLVPDARKDPGTRAAGQVPGEVEVRGLVRVPAPAGLFAARNDPVRNIWYWADVPAMTASAFPDGLQGRVVLPFIVDADLEPAAPGDLPRGGGTRLDLPNRHLEYAVTWYGLAATLLGVYLAFVISRLKAVA